MMDLRLVGLAALALAGCAVEEQGADAAVVASEQAPLPQVFTLEVDQVWGGNPSTFTITGGPPNGSVRLVRAVGGGIVAGPCPAPLGGECLDIDGPAGVQLTGPAITLDSTGYAQFTANVPSTVPNGVDVAFQAVAPSNAVGSAPIALVTGPNLPPDQYEPNDDAYGALPAWPLAGSADIADGTDFDWYTVDLFAGDTLTANIYFTHGSANDLDLYLRDQPSDNSSYASGYLVRGFSATDNETYTYTAVADGTHYSMVHNWSVSSTSPTPYDMDATITPAP
jgi:hypothetical protein